MFSREIQRQLESYFSAIGSNSERTIKMAKGLIIYNTTTGKVQARAAGAWVDLH